MLLLGHATFMLDAMQFFSFDSFTMWEFTLSRGDADSKSTFLMRHLHGEVVYHGLIDARPSDVEAGLPCLLKANDVDIVQGVAVTAGRGLPWSMSSTSFAEDFDHVLNLAYALCSLPGGEHNAAYLVWRRLEDKMKLKWCYHDNPFEVERMLHLYPQSRYYMTQPVDVVSSTPPVLPTPPPRPIVRVPPQPPPPPSSISRTDGSLG